MTDSLPIPLSSRLLHLIKVTLLWLLSLSILITLTATFSVLGYTLFSSTTTIPPGHALSVLYSSLIGCSVLIPPICLFCHALFRSIFNGRYSDLDMASILWMEYVPRALIIPVFVGGGALGLTILGKSEFAIEVVDRGHLVAASALGGFIFQVVYEVLRAGVVIMTLIRERGGERSLV